MEQTSATSVHAGSRGISLLGWRPGDLLALMVVVLLSLLFGIPLLWAVGSSLKASNEIQLIPPIWIPSQPRWQNFVEVGTVVPFFRFLLNSFLVAVPGTIGAVISSSLVGYGFANFRFPGRTALFLVLIATLMLPEEVTLIPSYVLYWQLGWLDTYLPLVVPRFLGGGAFAIFLFRQFFLTLPTDFFDAARIDGCGYLRYYWQILMPLSVPAVISLSILLFQGSWNDFLHPLIYLSTTEKMTVPVGLLQLQSSLQPNASTNAGKPTDHLMMAGAVIAMLPMLTLFFTLQRYFIRGVVMSGLKG
jgi:multiple sugar transport system permease protein